MKNQLTKFKNIKRTSFLIGDSETDGKDQVISESMGYAPNSPYTFAELNQRKLSDAKCIAERGLYKNIRIVTALWDGICNEMGIVAFKKRKETTRPFDFNNIDIQY